MPTKAELEEEIALLREVLAAFKILEHKDRFAATKDQLYNSSLGKTFASSKDPERRIWVQGYAARGW